MALGLVVASVGYVAVFSLNDVLDGKVGAAALDAGKARVDGYDIETTTSFLNFVYWSTSQSR